MYLRSISHRLEIVAFRILLFRQIKKQIFPVQLIFIQRKKRFLTVKKYLRKKYFYFVDETIALSIGMYNQFYSLGKQEELQTTFDPIIHYPQFF